MAMEEIKNHPVGDGKELLITGSIWVVTPEQENEKKIKKAKTVTENYVSVDAISSEDLDLGVVIKVENGEKDITMTKGRKHKTNFDKEVG